MGVVVPFFLHPQPVAAFTDGQIKAQEKVLRVGVTNCEEHLHFQEIINSFLTVVHRTFDGTHRLEISYLSVDELLENTRNKKLDLFLASSGVYRTLIDTSCKDIATVVSDYSPDPNRGDSAVIFTLDKRKDIQTLADLQGKSIAMKMPRSFAGWHVALGEVATQGYDPDKFFGSVHSKGWKAEAVFDAVQSGETDAGVVQACFLEAYLDQRPDLKDVFRAINVKNNKHLPCIHSAGLYPNWTVVITPSMPLEQASQLTAHLLSEPPGIYGLRWQVATDFVSVDKLLKTLRIEPYAYLREWSVRRVVTEYWPFVLLFCATGIALILYAFTANRLIKRRTAQLTDAILSKNNFEQQAKAAQASLAAVNRLNIINQVSGILVHELRQPISAIVCYARGLARTFERGVTQPDKLQQIATQIGNTARLADSIITNVRNYTKNQATRGPCDLKEAVDLAVYNFLLGGKCAEQITVKVQSGLIIFADPFELQLIFLNLLRNSSEALKDTSNAKITITAQKEEITNSALVRVEDNGTGINPEKLVRMNEFLVSDKHQGLGIGLKVVRQIVDSLGGEINVANHPIGRGLIVELKFPLTNKQQNERS